MSRTTMVVHGNYLYLSSDMVKEYFDVVAANRANVIEKLFCIFEEHDVIKCEVINEFAFAVRGDVGWEGVGALKVSGNFVARPTGEEGFPVMI